MKAAALAFVACVGAACAGAGAGRGSEPDAMAPFVGTFRGVLRMFGADVVREVPMGLDVLPIPGSPGVWTFRLHYGEGDTAQVRDYRLRLDDERRGSYRIDEQNGIVLAARRCGDELVSVFAVEGTTLVSRYRAVGAGIEFSLESFDLTGAAATGNGVRTATRFAVQRALLLPVAASR